MTITFRMMALLLLMLVVLLTVSRRNNDALWITFESYGDDGEYYAMMMGNGHSPQRILTHNPFCVSDARWTPDGKWLSYAKICDESLKVVQLRPGEKSRYWLYEEQPVAYDVYWSPDGQRLLLYHDNLELTIIEANGSRQQLPGSGHMYPQWSPDGEWIYIANSAANNEVDIQRIHTTRLATEHIRTTSYISGNNRSWSPDGQRMVISIREDVEYRFAVSAPDGADAHTIPFDERPGYIARPTWSPDGEWIAFIGDVPTISLGIYRVRPDGGNAVLLTQGLANLSDVEWSPDGQWLLFSANHDGPAAVYRLRADGSSLENLTPGPSLENDPHYNAFSGADFHPLWLIIAAAGLMILSLAGRLRP